MLPLSQPAVLIFSAEDPIVFDHFASVLCATPELAADPGCQLSPAGRDFRKAEDFVLEVREMAPDGGVGQTEAVGRLRGGVANLQAARQRSSSSLRKETWRKSMIARSSWAWSIPLTSVSLRHGGGRSL
jgi:hypothetical protein